MIHQFQRIPISKTKEYWRAKMAKYRKDNAPKIEKEKAERKAIRIAERDKRREIARIKKNEGDREKRAQERAAGKRDMRLKVNRSTLHYKQSLAKPKETKPVRAVKLRTDRKPEKQAQKILIKAIPIELCTPVFIKEIRATVYIKPGQDIEAVRAKYIAARLKF